MKYLDHRYELLQTSRGTLYHPTNAEFPIKQQIAEKIAGSGISYRDLKNIFEKFGATGLVVNWRVLSLTPSPASDKNNPYFSQDRWTLQSSGGNHKLKRISMSITTLRHTFRLSGEKKASTSRLIYNYRTVSSTCEEIETWACVVP